MSLIAIILLNVRPYSIFEAASPQATRIRALTYGFSIAALAILLLVIFLTSYIAIKYRHRSNAAEPAQVAGNRRLEFVMIAGPLLLVVAFFLWSLSTMNAVLP